MTRADVLKCAAYRGIDIWVDDNKDILQLVVYASAPEGFIFLGNRASTIVCAAEPHIRFVDWNKVQSMLKLQHESRC